MPYLAQQLGNCLTIDEAHHLAVQLKVSNITELIDEHPQFEDFLDAMIWKWRGKRPYASQVDFLSRALDGMGKESEADEIKLAFAENRSPQLLLNLKRV